MYRRTGYRSGRQSGLRHVNAFSKGDIALLNKREIDMVACFQGINSIVCINKK